MLTGEPRNQTDETGCALWLSDISDLTEVTELLVYPKLTAWEHSLGVVPDELDGMIVSPERWFNAHAVLPINFRINFRAQIVCPSLAELREETNLRRHLQSSRFLSYEIALPLMNALLKLRNLAERVKMSRAKYAVHRTTNAVLSPAALEQVFYMNYTEVRP